MRKIFFIFFSKFLFFNFNCIAFYDYFFYAKKFLNYAFYSSFRYILINYKDIDYNLNFKVEQKAIKNNTFKNYKIAKNYNVYNKYCDLNFIKNFEKHYFLHCENLFKYRQNFFLNIKF